MTPAIEPLIPAAASNGRKVRFDPTINLGHILTGSLFLASTVAAWVTMDARITAAERDNRRVEMQFGKDLPTAEARLMDRIKINETANARFELNYREDLRDIKVSLTRIEEKLDHKADKAGGR